MRFSRGPLAVACVAICALTIAACGGSSHPHASSTPSTSTATGPATSAAATSAAPVAVNPLTGLGAPSNNPFVSVKIDDTENGRPQVNIDLANIVYIEQVEGGLTRL